MKRKRIVSLLAAAAIIFSIHTPSAILAESGWNGTYQNDFEDQGQYVFISVPSDADISYLFDEDFFPDSSEAAPDTEDETQDDPALEPTPSSGTPVSTDSEFSIDGNALIKYQGKASTVFVPDGVVVIRSGAFAGNKFMTSVVLPDSVEEIEGGAFKNCSNLMFVTISGRSKLNRIGEDAFAGCHMLNTSFALDVKNVSSKAFPRPLNVSTATPIPATPKPTPTVRPVPVNPGSPFGDTILVINTPVPGSLRISRQPTSVQAAEGDLVTFIVVAEGSENIHYQWMRSKDGSSWTKIENSSQAFENASTNVLSFTANALRANYTFKCVVYDGFNTITSNEVSVRLTSQSASHGGTSSGIDPWETTGYIITPSPDSSVTDLSGSVPYVSARQISNTSAQISWTQVQSATGYELYRYTLNQSGEEEYVRIGTFTDNSYIDQGLNFTKNHYAYSVKAVLPEGSEQVASSSSLAEVKSLYAPAEVAAIQITDTSARITWSPSELASYYKLFRSVNGGKHTVLVQSVTGTEYTDTGLDFKNNTYSYIVQAEMVVPGSDTTVKKASNAAPVEEFSKVGQTIETDYLVYTITSDGLVVTDYKGGATDLKIPATVKNGKDTYTVIAIGPNVFWGNKTLKTITLPSTIQVIEAGAFGYCDAVTD